MRKCASWFFVAASIAGAACSDPPPKPPVTDSPSPPRTGGGSGGGATTDGGVSDGGSSTADGGDAGACTDLPITGAVIGQVIVTDDPPAGLGGQVTDGTYDITEALYYGGPGAIPGASGASYRGSIRITGQSFERHVIFTSAGGAVAETLSSGTFLTNANNGVISLTCPFTTQEQVTFTVNGNNLVITNLVTRESLGLTKTL